MLELEEEADGIRRRYQRALMIGRMMMAKVYIAVRLAVLLSWES